MLSALGGKSWEVRYLWGDGDKDREIQVGEMHLTTTQDDDVMRKLSRGDMKAV